MIDEILGKEAASDIFLSSMLTGLMTKEQSRNLANEIEKSAQNGGGGVTPMGALRSIGHGIGTVASGAYNMVGDVLKNAPGFAGGTILTGAGIGALGALAYDAIKENVSHEDPEVEFNSKIEEMYNNRRLEKADAKWMKKVRKLRDELKRGYKKMSTEEYTQKYNELMAALDERK